jgi:hypothetical protein
MQSQAENYRAKASEFARLAAITKARRDDRHDRKFAHMYWGLALGDEPKPFRRRQKNVLPAPDFGERRTLDGADNGVS